MRIGEITPPCLSRCFTVETKESSRKKRLPYRTADVLRRKNTPPPLPIFPLLWNFFRSHLSLPMSCINCWEAGNNALETYLPLFAICKIFEFFSSALQNSRVSIFAFARYPQNSLFALQALSSQQGFNRNAS